MKPSAILETILYAGNLDAAEAFYSDVLGLERTARVGDRHAFFLCCDQMLLIFNPGLTLKPPSPATLPVPPHGALGPGHVCFKASAEEIGRWRDSWWRTVSPLRRISNGRKAAVPSISAIRLVIALNLPSRVSGALLSAR